MLLYLSSTRTMHGHIMFRTRFGPGYVALEGLLWYFVDMLDLTVSRTWRTNLTVLCLYSKLIRQCALFKVLKAYSNYNNRVGYCQGMASVVATMLTFFDAEVKTSGSYE